MKIPISSKIVSIDLYAYNYLWLKLMIRPQAPLCSLLQLQVIVIVTVI